MCKNVLVSIIIRTCGNLDILKNALDSLDRQTYSAIEIVIVEDGPNISEKYIQEHYRELNVNYRATGYRSGRTHAGNIGLSLAQGKYINFLDEDDILLPRHIEVLTQALENSPYHVAYSIAEEQQIHVLGRSPYRFKTKRKLVRYNYPFNRLLLCHMNLFPIQSVMFERAVYESCGGFDESMDMLEDWDLWLRYALQYDFLHVEEITSVYYTPYKGKKKRSRDISLKAPVVSTAERLEKYLINTTAAEISREMDYVVNIFNKKGIIFYMKKILSYLLYHDR